MLTNATEVYADAIFGTAPTSVYQMLIVYGVKLKTVEIAFQHSLHFVFDKKIAIFIFSDQISQAAPIGVTLVF